MATVSFANLDQTFDITAQLVTFSSAPVVFASNTQFSGATAAPHGVYFLSDFGNLDYDVGDVPFGGVVTEFDLDLDNDFNGTFELSVSGLSFDLGGLAPLMSPLPDPEAENNLIWRLVLVGDDTVTLGAGSNITFAGDGRHVTSGQTLLGGADTITGNAGTFGLILGDFHTVAAGGAVYGGHDLITVRGGSANGDVYSVSGFLSGGDDILSVEAGGSVFGMCGDASLVTAGGVAVGGDDTITLSGGVATAIGDVSTVEGHLVGGDDMITGGNDAETLAGDAYVVASGGVARGGDDVIVGGGDVDTIFGDWANDFGSGSIGGDDMLFGDAGDDNIYGNGGNDAIHGGADKDTMYGGDGDDTFFVDADGDVVDGETYDGAPAPTSSGSPTAGPATSTS